MRIVETKLSGVYVINLEVFYDERGYFCENYRYDCFKHCGLDAIFVQDNQSFSIYGTLRGLHFQKGEWAQAKLIKVLMGRIYDVVVDIRPKSPTFGEWMGLDLSDQQHCMLYISRGFAHGFITLSSSALFAYKCDNYYVPQASCGIFHADSSLDISWPIPMEKRIISDMDRDWPNFEGY